MRNKLITILILLVHTNLFSQVNEEWVVHYHNSNDVGNSIALDQNGNVYVTGKSSSQSNGFDVATVKYNSLGVEQWNRRYNSPENLDDEGLNVVIDGQGNIIVSGISSDRLLVIKYNSQGVEQWVKMYDSTFYCQNMLVDTQGSVFLCGTRGISLDYHYVIVKYNSAGDFQWDAVYNEGGITGVAAAITMDPFGNVYITGQGNGVGPASNAITVKYNSNGVKQWSAVYNGPSNLHDWGYSISADSNYLYVGGSSYSTQTDGDYLILKYNLAGVQQWASLYNRSGNSQDRCLSIAVDKSGNVYGTGRSLFVGIDYLTVKYNTSGQLQWAATYNGPGNNEDIPSKIKVDRYGRAYVTGASRGNGTNNDITTIKYSPWGSEEWVARHNGPNNNNDTGNDLILDDNGNVYITGFSLLSPTGYDYVTIKYSQVTSISGNSNQIPGKFYLHQNYPNPFNPQTKIKFEIPNTTFARLIIYDGLGRQISVLTNQKLAAGSYEATWDASGFNSGIYYYKLETGDFIETKKMLLIK